MSLHLECFVWFQFFFQKGARTSLSANTTFSTTSVPVPLCQVIFFSKLSFAKCLNLFLWACYVFFYLFVFFKFFNTSIYSHRWVDPSLSGPVTVPARLPLAVQHFNFENGARTQCPLQPENTEYIIRILHLHFNIPTDTNKQVCI